MTAERINTSETENEEEILRQFWEIQLRLASEDSNKEDPVAQNCRYVTFVSRSNGRNRPPRKPRRVELVGYGKSHHTVHEEPRSPLDQIAQELLEDSLPPGTDLYEEFIRRLRKLIR